MTNCSTQLGPIKKKNFNLDINDALFRQYIFQVQSVIDNSIFDNPCYNEEIIFMSLFFKFSSYEFIDIPEITIEPNLVKYKQLITNDSNFIKFWCNILNLLSLWLNIGILDLHIYIFKLINVIKKKYCFTFHYLLRYKDKLYFDTFLH
jgi:hypothetical protein